MKAELIIKYIDVILKRTNNVKAVKVSTLSKGKSQPEFKRALQECIIDGIVYYAELNPELTVKRIA